MRKLITQKNVKLGLMVLFIGFILLQTGIYNNFQKLSTDSANEPYLNDRNGPIAQDNYGLTQIPFLGNYTALYEWLLNDLIDNSSIETSAAFFGETNRTGDEITDNNHYFEDFAVFMDGFVNLLGIDDPSIVAYFSTQKITDFWDSYIEQAGYYSWINYDWTENSTIKEFNGNAQPILSFVDYLISEETKDVYSIPDIITDQWAVLNDLFAQDFDVSGNTVRLFNHSSSDYSKYMEDQFIAAIAGFQIHRANLGSIDASTKSIANNTADEIMQQMTGTYFPDIYDGNSFDLKRDANMNSIAGDDHKELSTNAYGIWALMEWYLESGPTSYDPEDSKIQIAENVYNFLMQSLWNSTYSLFMKESDPTGSTILDSRITLEDNAIMMLALQKLFQVTGNFTYFETIVEMYEGLMETLYDDEYGTYYKWINASSLELNTNKSFGAHSYLLRTYLSLSTLSGYLQTNIETDLDEYITGENTVANITGNFYLEYNLNYSVPGTKLSYIVPVNNSDFFMSIRDPDGSVLDSQNFVNKVNGTFAYEFPLESDYAIDDYSIDIYANYTGLATKFNSTSFTIVSGLEIYNVSYIASNIRSGSTFALNFSINSSRVDPLNLTVKIVSDDSIVNQTLSNQEIINGTMNNFTLSISTLMEAKYEESSFIIEVYNGSILFNSKESLINIISPIEVQLIQSLYGFRGYNYNIGITFTNFVNFAENISINILGTNYLADNATEIRISAGGSYEFIYSSIIDASASLGADVYTLNITRSLDGEVIYYQDFTFNIKNPIEVLSLTIPEETYQGQQAFASCRVKNLLDISENINVYVDDEKVDSITSVIPGTNDLNIPVGNKFINPYKFGPQSFKITIKDNAGNLLYEEVVSTSVKASLGSIILGWVLPILIPVIAIVIVRHLSIENKKRLS